MLYPGYQQINEGRVDDNPALYVGLVPAKTVTVKAKLRNRFREFQLATDAPLQHLNSTIKQKFDIVDESGASVGVAYLLWLVFGFLGIHRLYLKQHNACSWLLWFSTLQLFGLGWIYDGFVLASNVDKYNARLLSPDASNNHGNAFIRFMFGFKDVERPSMLAAYLLWFFFGFLGVHRWYTGYQTPSSFLAWLLTLQIGGLGWFYDGYYTYQMVNNPNPVSKESPFCLKVQESYDYLPIEDDYHLTSSLKSAFDRPDRTLRVLAVEKKREDMSYLLWFFFGIVGTHGFYLGMDHVWLRFLTANYFGFGWLADGIRMRSLIARANARISGDFVPSVDSTKVWNARRAFVTFQVAGETFETA